MDKFSYAIGLGIGQNLLSMGAKGIEVDDFAQAIKDILEGNKTAISHAEARDIVNKYFAELDKVMLKEALQKEKINRRTGRENECSQHRARRTVPGRKQETS